MTYFALPVIVSWTYYDRFYKNLRSKFTNCPNIVNLCDGKLGLL